MHTRVSPPAAETPDNRAAALLGGLARLAGAGGGAAADAEQTALHLVADGLGVPVALFFRSTTVGDLPVVVGRFGDRSTARIEATVAAIRAAAPSGRWVEPLVVEDAAADRGWSTIDIRPLAGAFAAAPVAGPDGASLGVLCGLDDRPRPFAPEQVAALVVAAALLGGLLVGEPTGEGAGLTGGASRARPAAVDGPGGRRWPAVDRRPARGLGGRVAGAVGIADDPADRDRDRERSAWALLEIVLDASPDAIAFKDRDGRYRRLSAAAAHRLGLPDAATGIGLRAADIFPPEVAARLEAEDRRVFETGQPLLNRLTRDPRLPGRWYMTSKIPIRDAAGRIDGLLVMSREVTDLKLAEEAARAERDLLQAMIDAVPDFIHLKGFDGTFRRMNAAWAARLGLASAADGIGARSADFFSPQRAAELEAEDAEVMRTGEPLLNVLSRAERSPEERWVLRSKLPVRDAAGRVVGTVGIVRDITERKRAEDALATERTLLQTVINAVPDNVAVTGPDGRYLLVNRGSARLLGLDDPADAVGRRPADFLIPEAAERVAAQDRAVVERGEPILDELLVERRPDGSLRYYRHNRLALRDATGAVVAVVSASSDITALKEAEHALARERDLLQSILDALPANVYLKDAAGRYLRINRAAAHYLGLDDPAVAIGQTAEDLWPPDWAAEFRREDEAVLTGAPFTRQVEGVHADGVVRDYLYSRVPVHDGLGNVAGTVTVSTDVTVMKEAERRLAEALAKEQATTAELEHLSRAKSGFLSMLTHEFRTPLTAIQGYADLIHDREFDLSPEEIREYAGEIAASAQRLTRLTSDLLELDRVRAKRVVLGLAPTDLGAVARQVINLLRSSTGGHDFLLDLDGAVPPILADGDRLTQVVTNLIGNAIKYSPDGGTVTVRTRRDGDDVLLSVGDRGIGIPEELLEHIFEPYVRTSDAGGRGIVGTGLGLPIARELVTLHGGRIWAESRAGEGTTFTVRLPIAGPDAGAVGWE